jgi:hypothetical protein
MKKLFILVFIFSGIISASQTGTEILLFDIKMEGKQFIFSEPVNITNHKGYDNQPFFHPSKPLIYYSSFNDSGRSDIKVYNFETKETTNLTLTNEREYSPVVTPDEKFISCIIQRDNGAQDLGKYPIKGGKSDILISDLKVGYHAWASKKSVLLFVLGDSSNTLHLYDLSKKTDKILATNIGRSLHKIPGENAMSFVQIVSENTYQIQKLDLATGTISPVTYTIPGQEHITWIQKDKLLMGKGVGLYLFDTKLGDGWQPVFTEGDVSLLKGITRIAVNESKTKLAVVVSE